CLYRIIYLYVSNSRHSVYQEESVQRPISAFYDLYDIFSHVQRMYHFFSFVAQHTFIH
ncbi:hypothetical protein MKX03_013415, partial [Papaver bracteatum]